MLHIDPLRRAFLYPPAADLDYSWDEVKTMLLDGDTIDRLTPDEVGWYQSDSRYPPMMPPIQITDGPNGGGLILTDEENEVQPTLMFILLSHRLAYCPPLGIPQRTLANSPRLTILGNQGFRRNGGGKQCIVSVENIESAGNKVYWAIDAPAKASIDRDVESLSQAFSVDVKRVKNFDLPKSCIRDVFPFWKYELQWFEVSGGPENANHQLGILTYIGYSLKSNGMQIYSASVGAQITGKPNFRKGWQAKGMKRVE